MPAFASGSGSASAGHWDARVSLSESMMKERELEAMADCHISASQEDLLARAHFIGGEEEEEEEEEEQQQQQEEEEEDPQTQGQSQRGQAGEEQDGIFMCSICFTPTQPPPPPSPSPSSKPRKRICIREVRFGTKTPMTAPAPAPAPSPGPELDPLVRIMLMIPTAPLPTTDGVDILELARSRGIF